MGLTTIEPRSESFLVCGLGTFGQYCVVALKEFGVSVIAIEQKPQQNWEIPNLPQLLKQLIVGDCRQESILERAKIRECRTVLIVTSNEEVNAQTALIVRQINPQIRIAIRSAQINLNQLLREQLGNFFADEPTHQAAIALALAGLGEETIGFFYLDGQPLKVIQHQIEPNHRWCHTRLLHELNTSRRRILKHLRDLDAESESFYQWNPDSTVRPGDIIIYIEPVEEFSLSRDRSNNYTFKGRSKLRKSLGCLCQRLKKELTQLAELSFLRQVKRIVLVSSSIVLLLLLLGTLLFRHYYPETTWLYAFYGTAILLLGGYGDLFANFEPVAEIPWWLQLFALSLTLVGTAFVGVVYASLTEALLAAKFELLPSRPAIPQQEHLVVVGLGRVGQQVVNFLQQFKRSLVAVTFNIDFERSNWAEEIPLIVVENLKESLCKANLATAKSILITTNNEMLNLEIALMAKALNPDSNLVISTYKKKGLSDNLTHLLNSARAINAYEVGAEAFAAAAFGENILSLFRQNNQTILVTEYQIEINDTLNGLTIAEVSYGYEVVVILHQSPGCAPHLMPSEDLPLKIGDRIVVLANGASLRNIERGQIKITSRCWWVRVEQALNRDAVFEGANSIARISGCSLILARNLMNNLPQTLPIPLYKHQGQRLVRELQRALVKANLVPLADE